MTMSGATRPKTAVLLIHGMGHQSRYQTLLKVAELIEEQPGYSVAKLSPSEQPEGLERSVRVTKNGDPLADLYEYYWAPRTARLIGVTQTLLWFLRQSIPRRGQLARTTSAASVSKTALNVFWVLVSAAIMFFLSVGAANWAKASLNSFDEHQAGWTEVGQGFREAAAEFVDCFGEDDQTCSARD